MEISAATLIALSAGITALTVCGGGIWLRWYYETYNQDFFVARKRGTLWKFRCTQHPLYPGW